MQASKTRNDLPLYLEKLCALSAELRGRTTGNFSGPQDALSKLRYGPEHPPWIAIRRSVSRALELTILRLAKAQIDVARVELACQQIREVTATHADSRET